MSQIELRLGQPDVLHGPGRGVGHQQGAVVGHSDVLGGEDHEPPGDEAGILARLQHAGQPVQARVGVGAPDALDEPR